MSKSDLNRWCGIGRLTRNPELRETPSGTAVCDLPIACNRYGKDGQQFTTFVRVTTWNKHAEYLGDPEKGVHTGDRVYVEGELVNDDYEQTKGDPETTTRGRMKVDHARVRVMNRKSQVDDETEGQD